LQRLELPVREGEVGPHPYDDGKQFE